MAALILLIELYECWGTRVEVGFVYLSLWQMAGLSLVICSALQEKGVSSEKSISHGAIINFNIKF